MSKPSRLHTLMVRDEQGASDAPSLSSLFPFLPIPSLDTSVCWEWKGSVSSAGLPHRSSPDHSTSVSLRRLIWILLIGPLRGGLHPHLQDRSCELVKSTCASKRCLRPSHLYAIPATEYKPKPRETYQGIGPRKIPGFTPLSIFRRTRAEALLRLKREGYTNKAAAEAVNMSIKNAEKIIGKAKGTWKASAHEGEQCRRYALATELKTRLTVDS